MASYRVGIRGSFGTDCSEVVDGRYVRSLNRYMAINLLGSGIITIISVIAISTNGSKNTKATENLLSLSIVFSLALLLVSLACMVRRRGPTGEPLSTSLPSFWLCDG